MKDEEVLKDFFPYLTKEQKKNPDELLEMTLNDFYNVISLTRQAERKRILDILKLKRKWTREELRQKIKR